METILVIAVRWFILALVVMWAPSVWRNPEVASLKIRVWAACVASLALVMGWLG